MGVSLDRQQLATASWWELAGHDRESLTDAWRVLHYAAQPVAEIGKAFGVPKPDDSHTNLEWFRGANLLDGFLAGPVVGTSSRIRAAVRVWDMRLFLIEPTGRARAELALEGQTIEGATGWAVSAALEVLDEPVRQATDPAPDLPDHPLGSGATVGPVTGIAQAELIRLYANTSALLERARDHLTDAGVETEPVRTWPHHFDMATLAVLARDDQGAMAATVGVGLTPPDGTVSAMGREDEGYWYVSGWRAGGGSSTTNHTTEPGALAVGSWHARDGAPPMAVLPVSAVVSTEDPAEQLDRVTGFMDEAFARSVAMVI